MTLSASPGGSKTPKHIQTLELRSEVDQGEIATQPIAYDFSNGTPTELSNYCVLEKILSCSNVFTSARQPGNYRFTLTVLPNNDKAQPIVAQTTQITILPTPPPEILAFAATQPRYWEPIDPKLLKPETETKGQPSNPMALNWRVASPNQLSHLSLAGRLADGSILGPAQRYDLTEGLPKGLEKFCTLTSTDLTCRALPTNARTVGAYVFELSLFTPNRTEPIAIAKTDPVRIVPVPIRIETFTINGESAPAKYQVQGRSENDAVRNRVQLAWRILGGPYTQVELLPIPGSVPLVGALYYPLTVNSQEVVTLKVTSVNGDQITRSVTLETLQPQRSSPPLSAQREPTVIISPSPSEGSPSPESLPEPSEELRSPALPQPPAKPAPPRPTKPEVGVTPGDQPPK